MFQAAFFSCRKDKKKRGKVRRATVRVSQFIILEEYSLDSLLHTTKEICVDMSIWLMSVISHQWHLIYGWFFPATARVCWKCVLGGFGSFVMGPSRIWIFMKISKILFEHLKRQDFLDPDFFDTYNVGPGPFKVGLSSIFKLWIALLWRVLDLHYMCQKNLDPKNPGGSNAQIEIYLFS